MGLDPAKLEQIAHAVDTVDAAAVQRYLATYWAPAKVAYGVTGPLEHTVVHDPE